MKKELLQQNESNEYSYIPLGDQKNYYYTYDLGCAAALVSIGFELISLDKQNIRKVLLIIKRKKGIEKAIEEYWANKLMVYARSMVENTKMIKNRIFSE